jgi:hypothetical protein
VERVVAGQPPDEADAELPGRLDFLIELVDVEAEDAMEIGDDLRGGRLADADDRDLARLDHRHVELGSAHLQRERC